MSFLIVIECYVGTVAQFCLYAERNICDIEEVDYGFWKLIDERLNDDETNRHLS